MGRTREAIFSMLEARGLEWDGLRVVDVFAGSGSLSFEALSRGASEALLIESSPKIQACIRKNAEILGISDCIRIASEDAIRVLRQGTHAGFGLAFLDPPYRQEYTQKALPLLSGNGWLTPGAYLVCELEHDLPLAIPDTFQLEAERLFGQTRVLLLHYGQHLSPLSSGMS